MRGEATSCLRAPRCFPVVCLFYLLSSCTCLFSELAGSCLPWLGEAPWQGRALNNLAVAAASSSSLNLNVTCFVVFLLIFYGCTFAVFGFWKKKKTCWCLRDGNRVLLLKRELGRGAGNGNISWVLGSRLRSKAARQFLSSKLELKGLLVWKIMCCHRACRR